MVRLPSPSILEPTVRTRSSEPVWIALQELVDRCLGNLGLADRILSRFSDGLPDHLAELERLAATQDLAAMALRAHRLKGEAANVGCQPIHHLASQLEDLASQGLWEPLPTVLDQLREAVAEFADHAFAFSAVGG